MRIRLQAIFGYGLVGLSSILIAVNAQQQKPFQNHNALDVKTILKQHDKPNTLEAHEKHFQAETLAYVTPWNNRGILIISMHGLLFTLAGMHFRLRCGERVQGKI